MYLHSFSLAVDGSKIILPNTKENASAFGRISASTNPIKNQSKPVGGLLSTLHDCLNNTFLDMQSTSLTYWHCYEKGWIFMSRTEPAIFTDELKNSLEGDVFWVTKEALKNYRLADDFIKMLLIFKQDSLCEFFYYQDDEKE